MYGLVTQMATDAAEMLEAAGSKNISVESSISPFGHAIHECGVARMGNDPKTSVIDADHRTHDVKNLFLCDGSSLVTSGRGQPTMTIMALAFRAADRITELAKKAEISS
jgi:choline dehydrogenase-like flavoprotein